jgi:hypothetical protein
VKTVECSREQDVLDALTTGQWPQRAGDELVQHVASCSACGDLVLVVTPILEDRDVVPDAAHIPSSGAMWWRAQMRARRESAREAARPIAVAQIVGSLAGIALTIALAALLSPWVRSWMAGLSGADTLELPRLNVSAALLSYGWWLPVLAIGFWMLIAPLAIYFVVRED